MWAISLLVLLMAVAPASAGESPEQAEAGIHDDLPLIEGDYLGQPRPGVVPEPFASFVVAERHHKHSHPAFSPDGDEVWFSVYLNDEYPQKIFFMRRRGERWTPPQLAPFSGTYQDGGPVFSADGRKLFFYSKRPRDGSGDARDDNDIWYVERIRDRLERAHQPGATAQHAPRRVPRKAGRRWHLLLHRQGRTR